MKPVKVFRKEVELKDLLDISRGYLVKATDGKSLIVVQSGRVLIEKGEQLEGKRDMVIALYKPCRRIKVKGEEYLVSKIETRVSNSILEDIKRLRVGRKDVIIEAFSKRAKKVIMLYRDGNLCYIDGDYRKLMKENRAILDAYEILREGEVAVNQHKEPKELMQNAVGGD
jgi:hypothetical protein